MAWYFLALGRTFVKILSPVASVPSACLGHEAELHDGPVARRFNQRQQPREPGGADSPEEVLGSGPFLDIADGTGAPDLGVHLPAVAVAVESCGKHHRQERLHSGAGAPGWRSG
jgi:hypothetical protein